MVVLKLKTMMYQTEGPEKAYSARPQARDSDAGVLSGRTWESAFLASFQIIPMLLLQD